MAVLHKYMLTGLIWVKHRWERGFSEGRFFQSYSRMLCFVCVWETDVQVYNHATHLNVCHILVNAGAFWDVVALVEVEVGSKHFLTEPHFSKGVEEPLVIIISYAAAVLNLTNHVSHCGPWHTLKRKDMLVMYRHDTLICPVKIHNQYNF